MPRQFPEYVCLTLTFAVLLAGCEGGSSDAPPAEQVAEQVESVDPEVLRALPPGVSVESVEQGRELFVTCSVCHGFDGRGTQLGPSLRDTTWIHITGTEQEIIQITRSGVPSPEQYPAPMPVMGGGRYTDQELQALATYIVALGRVP